MKFSIITSTFNAAAELPGTARSLAGQTHKDFEWIIVDGASNDDTADVVASLGTLVTAFVSEKDSGIYNAWNKALPKLEGDWVLFLGAGDSLYDDSVLSRVSDAISGMPAAVTTAYGKVFVVEFADGDQGWIRDETWQGLGDTWSLEKPEVPSHQGVFHKASLFQQGFRFDERMKICADMELMLGELVRGNGQKMDFLVSKFVLGGISQLPENKFRKAREFAWVCLKLRILFKRPVYQLAQICLSILPYSPRKKRLITNAP